MKQIFFTYIIKLTIFIGNSHGTIKVALNSQFSVATWGASNMYQSMCSISWRAIPPSTMARAHSTTCPGAHHAPYLAHTVLHVVRTMHHVELDAPRWAPDGCWTGTRVLDRTPGFHLGGTFSLIPWLPAPVK